MKSKTSSYIKQTLGSIRNPVPSLSTMIATHPILSKDTHIQNYFPDKMYYFPKLFPKTKLFPKIISQTKIISQIIFQAILDGFLGSQKHEQLELFSKSQIDFFFDFEHKIRTIFVEFCHFSDKILLFPEFGTESVPFFNFSPLITF